MTLPEGVQPSGPTEAPTEAPVEPTPEPATDSASSEPAVDETETPEEAASDSALRTWAKENGIEDVPASGRLSAAWREQITVAMAAALDPKEEASAEAGDSSASSTSSETVTTETETTPESSGGEDPSAPTEVQPEFAHGGEYRSVFYAPNTFVTGQAYTA